MELENFQLKPIGIIHSEHKVLDQIPAQPVFAKDCIGRVMIYRAYLDGLKDIEEFSHIYLLPFFHKVESVNLTVKPYLQNAEKGLFATRYPNRPNPIGLSIVELIEREDNILHVKGIDILDGTPLLDIKPYSARFDKIENTKNGWQDQVDESKANELGLRNYKGKTE